MISGQNPLESFKDQKVLIVGDLMLDAYWYGKVDRISPEAPVPVVNVDSKDFRLGGAGNVALNIKPFEAEPVLFSVTGMDDAAEIILDQMQLNGLPTFGIVQSKSRPSTVKTRIWSKNQQLIRLDHESRKGLSESEENRLLERITGYLDSNKVDVIIFQDYNKGVLTRKVIEKVIALANEKNIPTVVDPKEKNFWSYRSVTLFKPNLHEIRHQLPRIPEDDLEKMAAHIFSRLDNDQLLITLSDKGIFYREGDRKGIIPARKRNVADVCGAGDTVVSVAALGVAKGWPLYDIACLSNLAGGLVCEEVGVVPVEPLKLGMEYMLLSKEG